MSTLSAVDHVELGVFLRTVLQRHFSSHALAQVHIHWSQITLCEGTCNKYKGRNWCSCQLSVFSLGPADIKEKHCVRFDLSKQVWSSVHWTRNLATGVLPYRHVVLPPVGKFSRKRVCFAKFSTKILRHSPQNVPPLYFWIFGWHRVLLVS